MERLADRLVAPLADRLSVELTGRLLAALVGPLADELANALLLPVRSRRQADELAARLTEGLARRVAALIRMRPAAGPSQTTNEAVAEVLGRLAAKEKKVK